ncbi:tryptophan synthase subunit alpha [Bacillus safensis]|uniref:tryptophan synthase subunit alpha n=1 Tax=Bacillus TaxID=1386 RepID=UPI000596D552|nr:MULTISPECIES: tryptophan synthase subunit alpha [Bacillus]MBW4849918.1 tryptophan synthase subunit alpha [Bacillaceae bacterium]TFV10643.1 tryptophan synthase subunit alpha [Bacillus stratosphericus]APJ11483.1 tryptophan synthase subunit alpha [Bacillus safensis]AYJ89266.1 tryptophan synthase subunit alpha [Bacillus safensis]KAB3541605.1 tryptophan synthase subunit alpha [Bacillus safensis]
MIRFQLEQGEKLFIPFITAGDPSEDITIDLAISLQAAGAHAIELGVPYSDPLADGPVIQRASKRALNHGMNIVKAIELAGKMKKNGVKIPVILFTYYNPVLQLDTEYFFALLRKNHISGLLTPDLPFEESSELQKNCQTHDISYISLVAPTSKERLVNIVEQAEGFVYCVSSLGVTGVRQSFDASITDFIQQVKQLSHIPVAVGFGISTREQVDSMNKLSDGVVVGSALVKKIEELQEQLLASDTRQEALREFETYAKTFSPLYSFK